MSTQCDMASLHRPHHCMIGGDRDRPNEAHRFIAAGCGRDTGARSHKRALPATPGCNVVLPLFDVGLTSLQPLDASVTIGRRRELFRLP
jgi:hypothetical protein